MEKEYTIYDWMTTKLKLKGLKKELFAMIYNHCKKTDSTFNDSLTNLSNITGATPVAISNTLKYLVEEEFLLLDTIIYRGNVHKNYYSCNIMNNYETVKDNEAYYNEDYIIINKKPYKNQKSEYIIYFLIKDDKIVYVGKSCQGINRIYQHTDKEFDSYFTINTDKDNLDQLEGYYINKFKPYYNSVMNFKSDFININTVRTDLRKYNVKFSRLKKIIKELQINVDQINLTQYITREDYNKIIHYLEENKNE